MPSLFFLCVFITSVLRFTLLPLCMIAILQRTYLFFVSSVHLRGSLNALLLFFFPHLSPSISLPFSPFSPPFPPENSLSTQLHVLYFFVFSQFFCPPLFRPSSILSILSCHFPSLPLISLRSPLLLFCLQGFLARLTKRGYGNQSGIS